VGMRIKRSKKIMNLLKLKN